LIESFFDQEKMSGLRLQSVSSRNGNQDEAARFNMVLRGSYKEMMDFLGRSERNCIAFTVNQFVSVAVLDADFVFSLDITLLDACEKNHATVFSEQVDDHFFKERKRFLNAFSIHQIRFMGYFQFSNEMNAVILLPDGQSANVRAGDQLGKENALITRITAHEVIVLQNHHAKIITYG